MEELPVSAESQLEITKTKENYLKENNNYISEFISQKPISQFQSEKKINISNKGTVEEIYSIIDNNEKLFQSLGNVKLNLYTKNNDEQNYHLTNIINVENNSKIQTKLSMGSITGTNIETKFKSPNLDSEQIDTKCRKISDEIIEGPICIKGTLENLVKYICKIGIIEESNKNNSSDKKEDS